MSFSSLLLAASPGRLLRLGDATPGLQLFVKRPVKAVWVAMVVLIASCVAASAQSTSVLEWNFGTSAYSAAANVKHAAVSTASVTMLGSGATAAQGGNYYMTGGSWVNAATAMNAGRTSLSPLTGAKEFYTTFTLGNTVVGDWSSMAVQLDYLRTATSPTKIQASLTWLEGATYRTAYSAALTLSGTAWTTLSLPLTSFYPTTTTTAPILPGTTFLLEIQAYTISTTPNTLSIDNVKMLVNSLSNTNYGDYSGFASASSTANSTLLLGASTSAQVAQTTNATASVNASDDGVSLPILTQGVATTMSVTVTNSTGATAYLNGWIDFNQNGLFDAGEQIATDQVVATGSAGTNVVLSFTVPATAATGTCGARFRITSTASPGPTGLSSGIGEVEDYVTSVTNGYSYSPVLWVCSVSSGGTGYLETYDTSNGTHVVVGATSDSTNHQLTDVAWAPSGILYGVEFGSSGTSNFYSINTSTGALTLLGKLNDSINGMVFDSTGKIYVSSNSNGDIFTFALSSLSPSSTTTITKVYTAPATVPDGQALASAGDLAWVSGDLYYATAGSNFANFYLYKVPSGSSTPVLVGQFKGTSGATVANVYGLATDGYGTLYAQAGNVVYTVNLSTAVMTTVATAFTNPVYGGAMRYESMQAFTDFGDYSGFAPAGSMVSTSLRMGALVDADTPALPNITATGDDTNGVDDEDGVVLPTFMAIGSSSTFTVNVTNTTGSAAYLSGWIDFGGNGQLDASDQVINNQTVPTGTSGSTLTFSATPPSGSQMGKVGARFRLSSVSNPPPTGNSGIGEVEDYIVTLCPFITVAPSTLGAATIGTAYSQTVTASGGAAPYTWTVSSGTLPAGLSLNASTGVLSGTPTAATSRTFTVQATDANGCTGTLSYTITPACPTLSLTPASLSTGTVSSSYSQTLLASNGTSPYAWTLTSGTLPTGLSLTTAGILSGVPSVSTGAGTALAFKATDAAGCAATTSYTLKICPVISLSPATLTAATVGTAYSQTLTATGGATPYAWSIASGTLPTGLSLSSAGVISGTPSVAATSSFTLQATDVNGCASLITYTLTPACPTITLAPATLAAGMVGTAYSQTLTATGGTAAYTWSVITGTLPAGLSLSSAGVLSGTPSVSNGAGVSVIIQAKDSFNCVATKSYTIKVCPVLTFTPATLSAATAGTAYSATIAASNGVSPYTYVVTGGTLPAGLTLSAAGVLSGTPTSTTSQTFTVQATDANGCTGTISYTLAPACPVLTLTPASVAAGTAGTAYSQTLVASGGAAPYTWSLASGALPAGLTLNASTGVVGGTPTASNGSGTALSFKATDANGCTNTITYTLKVCPVLAFTPTTLPGATEGQAYSTTVVASGGSSPYAYVLSSGTLPAGLTLTGAGVISGTPTSTASQTFTVQATDANSCTGTMSYTLAPVCPTITLTPASLPSGTVSTAYSQTLSASGGTAPYTWTLTSGTLPAGLTLTAGGVVSGTPTTSNAAGVSLTFKATDAAGCAATTSLVLKICPVITVTPATITIGAVGVAYSQTLTASGGATPYAWTVSSGSLPSGLTLSSSGVISGTPTSTISQTFTVQATDANGCPGTKSYTLAPTCSAITITPSSAPSGTAGTAYSTTLTASGGTAPYTWVLQSGTLPTGLSLSAGGVLSGTPSTSNGSGTSLTFRATDNNGCIGSTTWTLKICPVITLAPTTLSAATVGSAYSTTITASGGATPYAYSVTIGSLPAGLTLSSAGVLSGTPTSNASKTFTVQALDANGCPGALSYTLAPVCPTLSLTPASITTGTVGTAYSQTLAASNGSTPYTWTVQSGTLPAGLSLSSAGVVSGTPSASNGTGVPITFMATDTYGCPGTNSYTLKVCPVITLTPSTIAAGTVGTAYSQTITASGGATPYNYAVTSGTLPAGLAINSSTGAITGTPTTSNAAGTAVTVTATDVNGCAAALSYTLKICPVITVTPGTLAAATVGTAYSQTLAATGGAAAYSWSVTSGTLPTGLALSAGGVISGTPSSTTSQTFTVRAQDANGCPGSISYTLAPACPAVSIAPATAVGGTVGTAYSQALAASGGTSPYAWAVTVGTLPAGLSLNAGTGALTGTPTASNGAGTSITVRATDTYGCANTIGYTLKVCPVISLTPATMPAATVGVAYSSTITASGGATPYAYSVSSGTLPAGLSINGATGVISGTPTTSGSQTFTVLVTDTNGCAGTINYTVSPVCPTITLTPASVPAGTVGAAYSQTLAASGGASPYTWTLQSGTLPAGLSLTTAGVISGTPTTSNAAGTSLTFKATDSTGCAATISYTLKICPVITVTPASVASATVGTAYSQTLTASGGATPYAWSVTSGALPAGLSLSAGGVISGTPSAATSANFTVQVLDANGCPGTLAYVLAASCPVITITPASVPTGTAGTAYSQTLSASGGTAPYTWTVTSGTLPSGLSLSSGGVISGTPSASNGAGVSVTVQAKDSFNCLATASYTVKICPVLTFTPSTLPAATVGTSYSTTITANNGASPYAYAVTSGTLPAGLSLNASTGVLSGTPTASASQTFTIQATDANSCTGTISYTLVPACPTISISPGVLTSGTVSTAYSQTLVASGGTASYVWSVQSGTLPAGLTLSSAGVLSGTPTTSNGAGVSITFKATDANGCSGTSAYTFKICPLITVAPTTLADGTLTVAYSQNLSASGGATPYTYAVSSGTLPAGLALSSSTGALTGTPTVSNGTGTSITVTASDANGCSGLKAYNLRVCPVLTFSPTTLAAATLGTAYTQTIVVSGGLAPYTYSLTSGTLPAGLALTAAGVLSGTPTSTTSQTFTIQAVDTNGCVATKSYTLAPACSTITIAPATLPAGTVSAAYSQTLTATSGTAPYTWSLQSGTLPAGLTFTTSTGVIAGTPTTSNTTGVALTFKVTDNLGCTATIGYTLKICPVITVTPASLAAATAGTAYSQTLSASGGTAAYSWTVSSGSLPAGLALSSAGVISGTPTAAGTSSFTVQALDVNGCPGTKAYTITTSCPTVTITPATINSGTVGTAYAQTLTASGGTAPYVWVVSSGTLPAGLSLSTGGSITGTPTTSNGTGVSVTVTASDANNCVASLTYNLKICPVITLSPSSMTVPVVATAFSQTITASGGAAAYTYSVSSGALPAWATLTASTGVVAGTPTNTTSATFTITATDANGCTGAQSYTITPVCPTITLTPTSLANGTLALSYSASVTASGGTAAYTYAITAGTLPAGLSFNTSTGAVTGTPTAVTTGTTGVPLTIRATDAKGCQGLATVNLKICPVITVNPTTLTAPVAGTAYSQTFSGSGGTAPYTFAVTSGALPAWATLNASSGVVSGTPNSTTAATFTISATDANLCSGTRSYTVTPTCPTITLAPTTLVSGTVGTAYSQTVAASSGIAPYTYALTSGTLPAGLSLSAASGQISGTPTAATSGTTGVALTIRATDSAGCQGSQVVNLKICPIISLTPATLAAGTVGMAYSQTITASGGTAAYTYAVTSGTLPAGLSMTTAGVISGTPTAAVSANITITATDANGCPGSVAYTLAVSCPVISVTPATLSAGTAGTAYSQTLTATGGNTPYTWTLTSGTLPTGLTLSTAGVISGTPTVSNAAGTSVTVQASDKYGCLATATYTLKVCPVLAFSPASLASGTVGTAYSQTVVASNGATPYSYSVSAGTLPGGLTLNGSTGVISGTPTTGNGAGASITLQAVDANTCPGTKAYTLKICPLVTLSPSTLAASIVGTSYSQTITASGGVAPYTYAVTSGSLPAWTTLNATTGVISGMPNNVTSATFSITATDTNGCPGLQSYTITPTCPTLTLTPSTLPTGTAGTAYSQTLSASGGTSPYVWTVTSGVLPSGLSLSSAGVISGTPTASNATGVSITVQAADSMGCLGTSTYTFKICPVITVSPTTLAAATVGTAYSQTLSASGGASPYTFAVSSGALPAWASLNAATGVLSGTPNGTTSATFTISATDTNGCPGSRSYSLAPVCPSITVSPGSLALGTVGTAYSATVAASGGTSPYSFAVTSANLPAGLTLTAATGVISGTPTTATSGSTGVAMTVTATDSLGCQGSLTVNLKICPVITVNPTTLAAGTVGTAYSQTVTATGSSATPLAFSVTTGSLPTGLTLNSSTGVISGTPTTAVSANITITATDANGCSGLRAYTLATSCPVITVTPASLNTGTAGTAFSQTLTATGGTSPYTWTLASGTLPAGLSLSSAGVISGTPSASNGAGVGITVQASDNFGCLATKTYTFKICPVITVTPASLPSGTVGTAYSQTVTASGSTATPLTYAVTSGSLPAGLSLNASTGAITGTPTTSNAAGTSVTITATDTNACTGLVTYNLKICPVLTFTPATLANGTVGTAYSQTVAASGGASAYTYALSSGTLPAGLSFSTTTGVISGTPTTSNGTGTSLTFTATDANGCPGVVTYSLKICPVITVSPSSLANGTLGTAYSQTVVASGGATPYSYAVTSGTLPAGLSINSASGVISGTPTASNGAGTGITVTATDANGCTGLKAYTLKVCPIIAVSPASLTTSTVGTAYSQTFTATGGATPYTFSITSGALPAWATLNATTGVISGTPNNTASASFTVTATDVNGCPGTGSYTLGSVCPTITVTPSTLAVGTVSTAYSATITAAGGTAPYTYAITSGTLPAGLTLAGSTGVVSGTPTAATSGTTGTAVTVTVTDAMGCSGAQVVNLKICPVITITPASLGSGIVGTAYNQTLIAAGGTAGYTWSVTTGSLPTGLSLSTAGVISGTPTAAVSGQAFTVQALDANGCPGTKAYTMSAFCPIITVSPVSPLTAGTVGTAYTATLSASGGSSPYSFAVTSGTLPAGLSLSSSGSLSGTPTAATTGITGASFTVGATDQNTCLGSRAYTLKVCPVITVSGSPPAGTIGAAYTTTFTASGSAASPYTFSIISGALPAGLSLNASTGVVSGTPTATASANITMAATDANGCAGNALFTIAVGCPTITMTPASLPVGTVTTAYSQALSASGGASPYVWAVSSGTLPAGLSLSTAGVLSGTPTAATSGVNGTSVTMQATDANGCVLTKAYNLKICPVITVSPSTINVGTVGSTYNQGLSAAGGTTPYTWTLSSGTLPTGLSLNSTTGLISGTPTTSNGAGVSITVTATDANVCPGTKTYTLKICPVITVSPATMPAATVGTAYSQTVTASGGASPYVYSVSTGALPAWATLNASTGVISGTPNAVTSATFTLTATDANGCTGGLSYTIAPSCPAITIAPTTLPDGFVNGSYSQTLTASGGISPYAWAITSGSAPTGLSLSSAGALTGTPTAVGTYTFTTRASDANGCAATRSYTFNIRSLRVGNLVWADTNNNGLKDTTETGLSGITVELWSAGANGVEENGAGDDVKIKADVVTNASGNYLFSDVPPGSGYYVRIPTPPPTNAVTGGTPVTLDNGVDNDNNGRQVNPGNPLRSPLFALAGGTEPAAAVDGDDTDGDLTIDFGLAPTVSVGNLVFKDINHNGAYDPGIDVVVDGVTLYLFASGADPLSATPVDTTITAGGGLYLFSVRPGSYFVYIPPAMFAPGAPLDGTAPTLTATTNLDDNADQNLLPCTKPYALGCSTNTFTLTLGAEPTSASGETGYQSASDDSYDTNSDLTVDLGLYPIPPAGTNTALVTAPLAARVRQDLSGTVSSSAPGAVTATDALAVDASGVQPLSLDTFVQWQKLHPGLANGPTDSLDGGLFNNLLEYALGIENGVTGKPHFALESNALGTVDAVLVRRSAGHNDLSYSLEGSNDLAAWNKLTLAPAVTQNGDGTETLRYSGMPTSFVRLRVDLDANQDGTPEATATSPVSGWNHLELEAASQTFSMPLLKPEVYSGFAGAATGSAFAPGKRYYAEVISGELDGRRYEVDEVSSTSTAIAYMSVPPPANARIAIRPHWTLGELFPVALFHAGTSASNADRVMFFDGSGYEVVWLQSRTGGAQWVRDGDATLADAGVTVIGPAEGVMVNPREAPVTLTVVGEVRSWKFAAPLHSGAQLVGSGYPMALTVADRGMDGTAGFTAGANSTTSDQVRVWSGDNVPGQASYTTYFYRQTGGLGRFWSTSSAEDVSASKIFEAYRASYLISVEGNPGWLQPVPWRW